MFREALDYPTRPPAGGRAVLVGGTLLVVIAALVGAATVDATLAPVALLAVVPYLLVRGYYVRVVRTTVGREAPTPPSFGGVGRLLRDGIAALVLTLVYLLPAAAVVGPLAYAQAVDVDLREVILGWGLAAPLVDPVLAGVAALAVVALMYLLGAVFALPAAVATYAYSGRLRAALDVRTVVATAANEDYVVAWFVSMLLQALLLPVAYLLRLLIVGFFLHFLVAVGVRYCYGRGVGAARDLDPVSEPREDPESPTPAVVRVDDGRGDWP